jgi:hypothetical protein
MSRPKPNVLFEAVDKTYKAEQVLEADAIYAVCYDGQPINLRTFFTLGNPMTKYKKCSFSNPGHAFNLAERLNEVFKTNAFAVHKMMMGTSVTEEELKSEDNS